jgi:2-C-methyl-D-erythritol 4-phosphate cytidylyltransferase
MISAIIVAAGRGTRMGANADKLFLEVAGRPLIAHTWSRFDQTACIDEIVLVIREEMRSAFQRLGETGGFVRPFRLIAGGAHRQDSVWNGLQALSPESDLVAIHDGARPCVTAELIIATLSAAREVGAAVAAQRVTDTLKESADDQFIARNIDRSRLWAVQTPQTFRVDIIRRALAEVRRLGLQLTDDTAACERIGQCVKLVETPIPNPKATTLADLAYLEMLLTPGRSHSQPD